MKSLKSIFVFAIMMMIACPSFAVERVIVAFDEDHQRMHTIFSGDEDVTVLMEYSYDGDCGAIQVYDASAQDYQVQNYHPGTSKFWCSATLDPVGLTPGETMTFTATAHILGGESGFETLYSIVSQDMLLVVPGADPSREDNDYAYAQGCPGESLPAIIDIGQSYCATICHGSYLIPVFCEDPGYTPDLLQITIENGCGDQTECNNSGCTGLAEFDELFNSQTIVFQGCNLYLQLSYCGFDEGCICITRSDFFLPVEMNDFAAVAGDEEVTLAWSTSSENDNDYFEIERDGARIAEIQSQGNTASGHSYNWVDRDVVNGVEYAYTLVSVDMEGVRTAHETEAATPAETVTPTGYSLAQNYPNPFNSETVFSFSIPAAQHVTLTVFDVLGRQVSTVVNTQLAAGSYTHNWNAENLAAGVYMYTLTAGDFSQTNKMLYLK